MTLAIKKTSLASETLFTIDDQEIALQVDTASQKLSLGSYETRDSLLPVDEKSWR